ETVRGRLLPPTPVSFARRYARAFHRNHAFFSFSTGHPSGNRDGASKLHQHPLFKFDRFNSDSTELKQQMAGTEKPAPASNIWILVC
ncbi:unnamed protein product, partial [Urochloa humidicola]